MLGVENRRKFFRFRPSSKNEIKVYLQPELDPTNVVSARVDNVSYGGICCVLDSRPKMGRNQVINAGYLMLSKDEHIPFGGIVRWTAGNQFGIEFTMISQQNRHLILQYITRKELETVPV